MKKKNKMKKVLLTILIIWVSIFIIDFISIKTIKRPIFMIRTSILKDGGTKIYYGLGYKVIKYNTLNEDNRIDIGTWFIKYSQIDYNESVFFSKEYTSIPSDNMFTYKSSTDIINILKNGTGLIYIGFPECPWCQAYVPYVYDVAKKENLNKIYYYNVLEDRKNNSKEYLEIVDLLKEYLRYDEEGLKRIYVPALISVKNGEIVGFDDETSFDTKGYESPIDYWSNEGTDKLIEKITDMIKKINLGVCSECNE